MARWGAAWHCVAGPGEATHGMGRRQLSGCRCHFCLMPDLLPVSLVEMISELERDLLARKRVYHNRTYTRRLSLEKAERRLAIVAAILDNLRGQMSPQQLETLDVLHERKVEQRKQRAQLKKHRHARV